MRRSHDDDPESIVEAPLASYWHGAKRPFHILLFLLPLVLAYELCLALVLPDHGGASVNTVLAHRGLLRFFEIFGITQSGGLYLGGLVIIVVLLVWQILSRESWRVEPRTLGIMALEASILAIPLLIVSRVVMAAPAAVPAPTSFGELDVWSQLAISVGAGLYEELLFRMVLIALVHTLLVDLARVPDAYGAALAVFLSALTFTLYHDLRPGGSLAQPLALFYLIAGGYFGVIYLLRGFGIVVGAHAVYDIMTVLLPG